MNWIQRTICVLFSSVFLILSIQILSQSHKNYFAGIAGILISAILMICAFSSKIKASSQTKTLKPIFKRKHLKILFTAIGVITLITFIIAYIYKNTRYPIDLVKNETISNSPIEWIKTQEKGDITIHGWKAEREPDKPDTFLVKYTFLRTVNNNTVESGWWWEVNTKEKIVRPVIGDEALEKKYGLENSTQRVSDLDFNNLRSAGFSDEEISSYSSKKDTQNKQDYKDRSLKDKWRSLKKGMTEAKVGKILGEPDKISSNPVFITWHYNNGGSVQFDHDIIGKGQARLGTWNEPNF